MVMCFFSINFIIKFFQKSHSFVEIESNFFDLDAEPNVKVEDFFMRKTKIETFF